MERRTSKLLFSHLMVAIMVVPLVAWGHAPTGAASRESQEHRIYQGQTIQEKGALRVVQLTEGEVAALGLPPQGMRTMSQPANFANPAFQRTWERTDRPVAGGTVKRSWYWGPQPNSGGLEEDYAEGAGGKRLVQYFDKSRMEINNPNADPNNPFFVTNGLLTVELISGKMQVGNATYRDRWAADIPLASDPDDPNAPTYLSFQGVSNTPLGDHPANSSVGQPVVATIARNGTVGSDPTKSSYPDVNFVYFDQATKHNVPKAIWDFLNESGPVYLSATGQTANARLSDPWFYATGLPISEPYWARVKIAGQMQDVLIQAFERRVVTYVPNGVPGFKVQMGNIGQHYYDWRYKDAGRPSGTPVPGGTPNVSPTAISTPAVTPTNTPQPIVDQCADVPASINAIVEPKCGAGGETFELVEASGFQPGENVGIYVTDANQAVYGAPFQDVADESGRIGGIYIDTLDDDTPGIWAFTAEGVTTGRKAVGYFKILAPTPVASPTPGGDTSCSNIPPPQNMLVLPNNCVRGGTRLFFVGRGFQPGENVGAYITLPDQSVGGARFQLVADENGVAGTVIFDTRPGFPLGIWAMTFEGVTSHARAIGYFKLIP